MAGLQTLVPWAAAITTAADQTGALKTQLPLVNETLGQLSGFAPATSGTFPGLLNVIAGAINSFAVVGASTDNFQTAIVSALAAFTAANPAYTFVVSASAGEASSPAALEALGLPPGSEQLVFTLDVTATYNGTQTLSLTAGATDDNVAFSTAGTVTGTVNLNLTFGVALTANLSAQDATFVVLNGLTVGAAAQNTATNFRSVSDCLARRRPAPSDWAPRSTSRWSATAPVRRRRTPSAISSASVLAPWSPSRSSSPRRPPAHCRCRPRSAR
ncbi:MAG TPA: hypothetical protein VGM42_00370 [Rhodopila sp.]